MRLIVILFLTIVLFSCTSEKEEAFYPVKEETMTDGIYQLYKTKLDTAYAIKDHFEVGIQLSNLKAPSDKIFLEIEKGIKENPEECYEIYEWHKLYIEHNFRVNLVKADTLKFIQTYKLCEENLGKQAFIDYQSKKEVKHQERLAKRKKLDSTLFDLKLIEELKQIKIDDQKYRIEMSKKGLSEEGKDKLWDKQHKLDSINLSKVDRILRNGYPTIEKIGYEQAGVIWLVLHHQGESFIRKKYLPILRQAVEDGNLGKGSLKGFEKRSGFFELATEKDRSWGMFI